MEKKEWGEPELIVLVRSKPEEAVLSICKYPAKPGGWNNYNAGCYVEQDLACSRCNFPAAS